MSAHAFSSGCRFKGFQTRRDIAHSHDADDNALFASMECTGNQTPRSVRELVDFFSSGMGPHGNNHNDQYTPIVHPKSNELQLMV
jgi:hypothetical protein